MINHRANATNTRVKRALQLTGARSISHVRVAETHGGFLEAPESCRDTRWFSGSTRELQRHTVVFWKYLRVGLPETSVCVGCRVLSGGGGWGFTHAREALVALVSGFSLE